MPMGQLVGLDDQIRAAQHLAASEGEAPAQLPAALQIQRRRRRHGPLTKARLCTGRSRVTSRSPTRMNSRPWVSAGANGFESVDGARGSSPRR